MIFRLKVQVVPYTSPRFRPSCACAMCMHRGFRYLVVLDVRHTNPRPDTVFRHLRPDSPPPLGVSKRSVVELRGKDQQIALAEYSRLVILFFCPRARSNFLKFHDFSTSRVHISKTACLSVMKPSPSCSPFNSAQNEVFDASRLNI